MRAVPEDNPTDAVDSAMESGDSSQEQSLRSGRGPAHATGGRRKRIRMSKRRRGWVIGGVVALSLGVLVAVGSGAWIGVRGLEAKESLEHAQTLVGNIQDEAAALDFSGAAKSADALERDTARAVELTSDPIWGAAEAIPFLGSNLLAVRQIAEVTDSLATDAVSPLMAVARGGIDSLKPVDGRLNVQLVTEIGEAVKKADGTLAMATQKVDRIETEGTIDAVSSAKAKLEDLLAKASTAASMARPIAEVAPGLLGADGPRKYILLFQNNAESMSLGGNTAAWVILNVENGALSIGEQPGSADFPRDQAPPLAVDPSLDKLYGTGNFNFVTNITIRPDFPAAAQMAQAFWQRKSGVAVDGVVALDPIALSYILAATGPLTLPSGQVLAADNAVSLLLSDVYKIYPNFRDQDAFFAQAAAAVFTVLTSATPDVAKLTDAITLAIADNRLMAWSSRPDEQVLLKGTPLEGVLAPDNNTKTEIGVFFVENSASKMSYYLRTTADLMTTQCLAPDAPVFSATVSLHSDITPAQYRALPLYVKSQVYISPVFTRTMVFIYGPPGTSFANWSWDQNGMDAELVEVGTDLGRPVAQVAVKLRPGEKAAFAAQFTAAPGEYGPLASRVTPMVQPTGVSLNSPGC